MIESAWIAPLRLAEAADKRKAALIVVCLSDAEFSGSNGGFANASKTAVKFHGGVRVRTVGRRRKNPLMSFIKSGESVTDEPSANPVWMVAIADL